MPHFARERIPFRNLGFCFGFKEYMGVGKLLEAHGKTFYTDWKLSATYERMKNLKVCKWRCGAVFLCARGTGFLGDVVQRTKIIS